MFLTFEGLDCSGKSTQASLLVEDLQASGATAVHLIREPGGTAISERLRAILLDRSTLGLSDLAELFLFSAARAQLVREVILPALGRGEIVVCDRFHDSTEAYQGYGRGLDLDAVRRINALATSGAEPDLTVLIDIPVAEVDRRRFSSGAGRDRMEDTGAAFFTRVRDGYLAMARAHPERILVMDGMREVGEIARDIRRAVAERQEQLHREER
jgi:dTMP kinase